jgi:hypothetical protein
MPRRPSPIWPRDSLKGNGWASAAPNEPSSDRHSWDLAAWPPSSDVRSHFDVSVATPIWRALRGHAAGTPILDHDVSRTGWQILGRAMQSITTMMPVWQCGHSRNDTADGRTELLAAKALLATRPVFHRTDTAIRRFWL